MIYKKNKIGATMENRKKIMEVLQKVHNNYEQLKDLVEKATDKELENILDSYFEEFGYYIESNFHFMEMIVTRIPPYTELDSSTSKMSNEELKKNFVEHWDLLFSLY